MMCERPENSVRVLVVGQTPPPYGGQAIMIQKLLEGNYKRIELFHVRMSFSKEMGEAGSFKLHKILELLKVIVMITRARLKYRPQILYYPPSGPKFWPVLRDIAILAATRWMFPKVVFHFHAGGLGNYYTKLPSILKPLFRKAYFNPAAAIHLSKYSPSDGESIQAGRIYVIPNGIEDVYPTYSDYKGQFNQTPVILFVGALYESKGVFDLLHAAHILKSQGYRFQMRLMGQGSEEMETAIRNFISENGLNVSVKLIGVKIGDEKWREFAIADIFCFPTYFEAETFGVVLLEAMMFGLPIVATRWRGIPALVKDGENGFLVPIKTPEELAEKLKLLLDDKCLRKSMGRRGREIFLKEYTIDKFRERMEQVFLEVYNG